LSSPESKSAGGAYEQACKASESGKLPCPGSAALIGRWQAAANGTPNRQLLFGASANTATSTAQVAGLIFLLVK
jgi:hypothetical protein